MSRRIGASLPIYGNKIKANKIGTFVHAGHTFHVIKPGYDSQGRRRITWTQFVHDGVPIFEVKLSSVSLDSVFDTFYAQWDKHIGDDAALAKRALEAVKKNRLSRFMDGKTGESPAPSVKMDGRPEGKKYSA